MIEVDLGNGNNTAVQVETRLEAIPATGYNRWVGTVNADFEGQKLRGPGGYEMFNIPVLLASLSSQG